MPVSLVQRHGGHSGDMHHGDLSVPASGAETMMQTQSGHLGKRFHEKRHPTEPSLKASAGVSGRGEGALGELPADENGWSQGRVCDGSGAWREAGSMTSRMLHRDSCFSPARPGGDKERFSASITRPNFCLCGEAWGKTSWESGGTSQITHKGCQSRGGCGRAVKAKTGRA